MSDTSPALIHYEIEILRDTLYQPLCENRSGVDAFDDLDSEIEMTTDELQVTCPRCCSYLGIPARFDEDSL